MGFLPRLWLRMGSICADGLDAIFYGTVELVSRFWIYMDFFGAMGMASLPLRSVELQPRLRLLLDTGQHVRVESSLGRLVRRSRIRRLGAARPQWHTGVLDHGLRDRG